MNCEIFQFSDISIKELHQQLLGAFFYHQEPYFFIQDSLIINLNIQCCFFKTGHCVFCGNHSVDQGCQTHFSSGAAWSKSILTRAGLHNRKFLF